MPRLPAGLHALNMTQFLGAMNDNILKLLIIFFLIRQQGPEKAAVITALVGAAFALPFLLCAAPAGCLADRYSKSQVTVWTKALEVVIGIAAVALFGAGWAPGLYPLMFLMAAQSALFAPAKYGLIPELVPDAQLAQANGLIEAGTFLAIICGSIAGPLLTGLVAGRFWLAACCCLLVALVGLASAIKLPQVSPAAPDRKIGILPTTILRTIQQVRADRDLLLTMLAFAWFWLLGAFAQLNLIPFGLQALGLTEVQSGYLFLASAFGIAGGSLLAARLCGTNLRLGIVPFGGIGLSAALLLLWLLPGQLVGAVVTVLLFGLCAGIYSLPLQAAIQKQAPRAIRGEVLAASSFLNWIGILLASAITFLLTATAHLSAAQSFASIGVVNLLMVLALAAAWPALRQIKTRKTRTVRAAAAPDND